MDLIAGRTWSAERRPIRHIDGVLIFTALALSVMGMFLIYSATRASLSAQHLDLSLYVKKQTTALALGIILLLLVATFDYRFAKVYAGMVYGAMIALLVLVRTPLGTTALGAQRGFTVGGFQFTPSEPAKVQFLLPTATQRIERSAALFERQMRPSSRKRVRPSQRESA